MRKYFNEEARQNALEMVRDIRAEFETILKEVEWMDDETRKNALDKAKSMATHIAYPDELLDDTKLEEFYQNVSSIDMIVFLDSRKICTNVRDDCECDIFDNETFVVGLFVLVALFT